MIFANKDNIRDGRLTVLLVMACALVFADSTIFDQKLVINHMTGSDDVKLCVDQDDKLVTGTCFTSSGVGEAVPQIPVKLTPLFFQPLPINRAESEMLITIKGVGPVLAGNIINYRKQIGTFNKVEDLMNLKGVGSKRASYLGTVLTFDDKL